MSAQLTDEEALNRVASYCSTAEHCRAEINEKLQRWGIAYDTIARILDRLESEKFIDDERFCRAFVNDKFRFAKWGKMKIAQGLYMKKNTFLFCVTCWLPNGKVSMQQTIMN